MKKLLIAILAIMLMLSFAACSAPASSDDSTASEAPAATEAPSEEPSEAPSEAPSEEPAEDLSWQAIEDKGSFILGFDAGFAPMGFKDESGEYVGFDIDLANEVASRLGLEIVFQPINWDTKEMELKNGNIDVIWNGLTITEERKENMLFSDPYMNNQQIIVVAADSGIASKADLAGKTVAAQVDSSAMEAINAEPDVKDTFSELIESPDYVEALMELKQGSVDAVVVDEMTGRYYVLADDPDNYIVLDDTFGEEQYGIGFRLEDQAFRDKIQETLNAIIADGTAAEISQKWFGDNVVIGG
jgi:polar amino acid transport system substrate-binding protein